MKTRDLIQFQKHVEDSRKQGKSTLSKDTSL